MFTIECYLLFFDFEFSSLSFLSAERINKKNTRPIKATADNKYTIDCHGIAYNHLH